MVNIIQYTFHMQNILKHVLNIPILNCPCIHTHTHSFHSFSYSYVLATAHDLVSGFRTSTLQAIYSINMYESVDNMNYNNNADSSLNYTRRTHSHSHIMQQRYMSTDDYGSNDDMMATAVVVVVATTMKMTTTTSN